MQPRCSPGSRPLPEVRPGQVHVEPVGGEDGGGKNFLQSVPRQSARPVLLQTSLRLPLRPQSTNIPRILDGVDWTGHLVRNDNQYRLEIFNQTSPLIIHRITKI